LQKSFELFFAFELSLPDNFLRQNLHMSINAALFILNVDDFCLDGRIDNSAHSQLVHLIFATCMPWLRNKFAAPNMYSCNWFAVVSQSARHGFRKAHANAPAHRSYSALRGRVFCNRSARSLQHVCQCLELHFP
jgi:hypothetical protein